MKHHIDPRGVVGGNHRTAFWSLGRLAQGTTMATSRPSRLSTRLALRFIEQQLLIS